MKFLVALTILAVAALVSADDWNDEESYALPADLTESGPAEFESAPAFNEPASAPAAVVPDAKKRLIESGVKIYEKFLDGNYVDADGNPDLAKAPAALAKETSDWATACEKAGYKVEEMIELVENEFV